MNKYLKDFQKKLKHVSYSRGTYELFSDWLTLVACSLYNGIHADGGVEKIYMDVAGRYSDEELTRMAELLAVVTDALTDSSEDFLGVVYQELELANGYAGQFFTPDSLSQMVAEMVLNNIERKPGRVNKISEPACGSGGMIIASFNKISDKDKEWTHVTAQDLDVKCFYMTYIQLSLLGISAEVILGNTLSMEIKRVWKTFGYYALGMSDKLKSDTILTEVLKES